MASIPVSVFSVGWPFGLGDSETALGVEIAVAILGNGGDSRFSRVLNLLEHSAEDVFAS